VKVDFNNVRRKALAAYKDICGKLNDHNFNDTVEIPTDDLRRPMDNLRDCLVTICLTYDEGNADFLDVLGDEEVPCFAPEE